MLKNENEMAGEDDNFRRIKVLIREVLPKAALLFVVGILTADGLLWPDEE